MKKLVLVLTPVLLVAACMKKSTSNQHCYTCYLNDSAVSTIPTFYNNAHLKDTTGDYCGLNPAQEQFMVKEKTHVDTLFYRNDTLVKEYWTMTCVQND